MLQTMCLRNCSRTLVIYKIIIQLVKHADKEYTKTSYISLNIGWEVLSCSEAIAWRSLSETGTCFIQKIYAPSSSFIQGKYLPFSPSPLRLNIFRLFVILSLTQLYRYTP
jgi:hypothetical protein